MKRGKGSTVIHANCQLRCSRAVQSLHPIVKVRRAARPYLFSNGQNIYNRVVLLGREKKKEYAYNQSYARTSAVLPEMRQTEKEREENHMSGP